MNPPRTPVPPPPPPVGNDAHRNDAAPLRVGVVSYLNTQPLIDGLEDLEGLELRHSVPSLLIGQLLAGEVEVALCSSIDHQRSDLPLSIVPVGMLGCRGATLTVRLYSACPLAQVRTVHADTDSHTSVALLRILLAERFGVTPTIVPFDARKRTAQSRVVESPETVLLIGDKVVTAAPPDERYPHQLDLGAEWHAATGLPFVFAVWMARTDADPQRIAAVAAILDRQRRHNRERIGTIIRRRAVPRGWPADLARHYLVDCLRYEFDDAARRGMELYFDKAHALGLTPARRVVETHPALADAALGAPC